MVSRVDGLEDCLAIRFELTSATNCRAARVSGESYTVYMVMLTFRRFEMLTALILGDTREEAKGLASAAKMGSLSRAHGSQGPSLISWKAAFTASSLSSHSLVHHSASARPCNIDLAKISALPSHLRLSILSRLQYLRLSCTRAAAGPLDCLAPSHCNGAALHKPESPELFPFGEGIGRRRSL